MADYGADDDDKKDANDPKGVLHDAHEAFKRAQESESDNREAALDDIKFARLEQQWDSAAVKQRRHEGRPCLTINKLAAHIRQVVNDARQNKPSVKVHPVDSAGDPETAEIFNGIIRHIEYASNADVAYDTGVESAVGGGFGYWRISTDYAWDDTFDLDIRIDRIADPFTVFGDPDSTAADSSDWNSAFVVERMSCDAFEAAYPKAEKTDWEFDFKGADGWRDGDHVLVAEWWTREQITRTLVKLTNGAVVEQSKLDDPQFAAEMMAANVMPDPKYQPREVRSYKVRQRIMTGAEILEEREWPGKYIPIIPVYGDEINVEGKRHLRSLIRSAKDAQRMFNYWRSTATELVALAPRVPFIGEEGVFAADADKWATVNTVSHAFVEYKKGMNPPQRQSLDSGPAGGALQEALNASDDIKAITGQHDASLGARSNETSGRAILARQREGDVSTFHFIDNLSRAIRHTGRVLLDLIPHIYNEPRIVRIIGEDDSQKPVQINAPTPQLDQNGHPEMQRGPDGQPVVDPTTGQPSPVMRVYDLTAGKYDLTIKTGPSYTTQRQESVDTMTALIQAQPQLGIILGDLLFKNMDLPESDEIARRLKSMLPPQAQGEDAIPPELKAKIEEGQKLIEEGAKHIQELEGQLEQAKSSQALAAAKMQLEAAKLDVEREKARTAQFEAETDRMKAQIELMQAQQPQMRPMGTGSPLRAV